MRGLMICAAYWVACGSEPAPTQATPTPWPACPAEATVEMLPGGTGALPDYGAAGGALQGWDVEQHPDPGAEVPAEGLDLTLDLRTDEVHLRCETRVRPVDRTPPALTLTGTWTPREGLTWSAEVSDDVTPTDDLQWTSTLDGVAVADLPGAGAAAPGPHCLAAEVTDGSGNTARAHACELAHPEGWRPLPAETVAHTCRLGDDGYTTDTTVLVHASEGWDPRSLDASTVRLHLVSGSGWLGEPSAIAGAYDQPASEGRYDHEHADVVAAPCGARARFVAAGLERCPDALVVTGSDVVGGSWTAEVAITEPSSGSACDPGTERPRRPTAETCACTWRTVWVRAGLPDVDISEPQGWLCGSIFTDAVQIARSSASSTLGYIGASGWSQDSCEGVPQASTQALSRATVRVFAECTPRRCGDGCCGPHNTVTALPAWTATAGPIDEDASCHVAGAMLVSGVGVSSAAAGMFTAGAQAARSVDLGVEPGVSVSAAGLTPSGSSTATAAGTTSAVVDRCAFDLTFQGAVDHHAAANGFPIFAECAVWTSDAGFHTGVDAWCADGSDAHSLASPSRFDVP